MSIHSRLKNHASKISQQTKHWAKIYVVSYLVITLLFVICTITFIYKPLNDELVDRQTQNLTSTVQSIASALSTSQDVQNLVDTAANNTDLRITVVAADGTVLADSEVDPSIMENHADREEIIEALQGNTGTAQRISATDGESWLYVAVPAEYQSKSVAVRASEPSTAFTVITQNAQIASVVFIALGCILVLIVAIVAFRKSHAPLKKFDQVRSDFVANASHELKTPVAGIRLLSEAIRDASEIDDKKNLSLFIDRLENEVERLQRLVTDLLDLSRLEESPNSERTPRTDLHSSLVTSFIAHKGEAEDKQLEFVLHDHSGTGDDCYADMEPSDASLVFDNLIENAIRYTEEGSITVTFETRKHNIVISVEDTGIGIPQADQTRIFERFYRVDKARSRELGGTGLGLSLVRHAVERSGGTVSVKSSLDKGSLFSVSFPRSHQ